MSESLEQIHSRAGELQMRYGPRGCTCNFLALLEMRHRGRSDCVEPTVSVAGLRFDVREGWNCVRIVAEPKCPFYDGAGIDTVAGHQGTCGNSTGFGSWSCHLSGTDEYTGFHAPYSRDWSRGVDLALKAAYGERA